MPTYRIQEGTERFFVLRYGDGQPFTNFFMKHFGAKQDYRKILVLPDHERQQAEAVIGRLERGEITEAEARIELDKIA